MNDRMADKADELKGRAKEAAGAATDDEELRAEGRSDQTKSKVKQKIDDAADTLRQKLD